MRINISFGGIEPLQFMKICSREFNFIAMDENGTWNVFINRPDYIRGKWRSVSRYEEIPSFIKINCDEAPQDSLHRRLGRANNESFFSQSPSR